jgi:ABC-type glycerol-3-phosphate transport system permease component
MSQRAIDPTKGSVQMSGRRTAVVAFAAMLAFALVACTPRAVPFQVRFEPSGAALTAKAAEALASTTDIAALSSVTTTVAVALRATVLAELRAKGSDGARAADLLTIGFPARTASVPVLVRLCPVDGTSAVIVVEAYGDTGGRLTHRRLWIFARDSGALIRAASFK